MYICVILRQFWYIGFLLRLASQVQIIGKVPKLILSFGPGREMSSLLITLDNQSKWNSLWLIKSFIFYGQVNWIWNLKCLIHEHLLSSSLLKIYLLEEAPVLASCGMLRKALRPSLDVSVLTIRLHIQGTRIWSPVRGDPVVGQLSQCVTTTEANAPRAHVLQPESHHSEKPKQHNQRVALVPQLEKAHMQQWRPSIAKWMNEWILCLCMYIKAFSIELEDMDSSPRSALCIPVPVLNIFDPPVSSSIKWAETHNFIAIENEMRCIGKVHSDSAQAWHFVVVVVQSLGCVSLSANPWTAAS